MPAYNFYDIKPTRLARWMTPKPNRKPGFMAFMQALLFPLFYAHDRFIRYREAKLYQIMITPQVAMLELLLNDKYDSSEKRIYITDAEWHLPVFLFQEDELQPVYFFRADEPDEPVWLYTEGEAGEAKTDFVVHVPDTITLNEPEMRSYLDQYRLFGTKYKIEQYAA
ncbi:MAG: hypothetical protein QM768_21860 [Agriterribacter sp.]